MKSLRSLGMVLLLVVQGLCLCGGSQTLAADEAKTAEARVRQQLQSDLRDVISSWAGAWQSQFEDVYLLHYHPEFKPEGFASVEAWRKFRRTRVTDPGTINIALKEFELVETHGDTAVVRFWLTYSRPGYADRTHKEMGLRLQGHIWMIEREHNLAVTKLAPP